MSTTEVWLACWVSLCTGVTIGMLLAGLFIGGGRNG